MSRQGEKSGVIVMVFRAKSPVDVAIPPSVDPGGLTNTTTDGMQVRATDHRAFMSS